MQKIIDNFKLPEPRVISPLRSALAREMEPVTSKQLRGKGSLSARAAYGTADVTLLLQRVDYTPLKGVRKVTASPLDLKT